MTAVVRAVDVGFGYTKFTTGGSGSDIRCASFPSLACLSTRDPSASLGAERRRTYAIPIKNVFYEVGPDVALAGDGFRCVFRRSVTDRFGTVTAEFGSVTEHFGDVTDARLALA